MNARSAISLGLVLLALSAWYPPAHAQGAAFPSKRITVVVPAAAGGATDIVARIMAQSLTTAFGQNVVVENRTGASGNVGSLSVMHAEPDGHTLLLAPTNNLSINQFLIKNIAHDPVADFAAVALVAEAPELIAVHHAFPAADVNEFIAVLRANPGQYNYGTPGVGSIPHLSVERFLRATGTRMVHVPYRGSAAAMADVASGSIQMSMATLGSVEPFRQAKTARILAVTASKRLAPLPDIPTLEEAGWKNLEMSNWWGVVAPKGTPPETIKTLNAKLREVFSIPAHVAQLERLGIVARSESVEYLEGFIREEAKLWEAVVKELGLSPM